MTERILIIGSPGAGKSTLAQEIANKKERPLISLDRLQWKNNQETVEPEIFLKRLSRSWKKIAG